jgi:hypothetical protein
MHHLAVRVHIVMPKYSFAYDQTGGAYDRRMTIAIPLIITFGGVDTVQLDIAINAAIISAIRKRTIASPMSSWIHAGCL